MGWGAEDGVGAGGGADCGCEVVGGGVAEGYGLGAVGDCAGVRVAGEGCGAPGVGGGGVDGGAVAAVGVADGVLGDVGGDELALRGDWDGGGRGGGRD